MLDPSITWVDMGKHRLLSPSKHRAEQVEIQDQHTEKKEAGRENKKRLISKE